jgi:hypothetical protein
MRTQHLVGAVVFIAVGLMAVPTKAQSQCPTPWAVTHNCQGASGCVGFVTYYFCSGYGTGQTCGEQACGAIRCCGATYGCNKKTCGSTCVGCKPGEKGKGELASVESGSSSRAEANTCGCPETVSKRARSAKATDDLPTEGTTRQAAPGGGGIR